MYSMALSGTRTPKAYAMQGSGLQTHLQLPMRTFVHKHSGLVCILHLPKHLGCRVQVGRQLG